MGEVCRSVIGGQAYGRENRIKTDIILKNFWRENERFADLFNTAGIRRKICN